MTTQLATALIQQVEVWGREGQHIREKAETILALTSSYLRATFLGKPKHHTQFNVGIKGK